MISVVFTKTGDKYLKLETRGHANYEKNGSEYDVVCTAASVLIINTVNAIERLTKSDVKSEHHNQEGGVISVEFNYIDDGGILLMDACLLGLLDISEGYGNEYLSISVLSDELEEELKNL